MAGTGAAFPLAMFTGDYYKFPRERGGGGKEGEESEERAVADPLWGSTACSFSEDGTVCSVF
jgi:hypothetical protein